MDHPNVPRPNNRDVVTDKRFPFRYDLENAPVGQKMILLQEGGVALLGMLTGRPEKDKGIIGWFSMPVRDRDEERKRGYIRPFQPHSVDAELAIYEEIYSASEIPAV